MYIVGHGIDIVSVARIERIIADHGDRFLERCFTPREAALCSGSKPGAERLAARFAAKEAVLKALGTGLTSGISWTEIDIERGPDGRPSVALTGCAREVAESLGINQWWISLSHTDGHAVASVIAVSTS